MTSIGNVKAGLFTPAIQFNNSSTGITYADRWGVYYTEGRSVIFSLSVLLSSKGSATGTMTWNGLPENCLTPGTPIFIYYYAPVVGSDLNLTAGYFLASNVNNIVTNGGNLIQSNGVSINYLDNSSFNNNSGFQITGFYRPI